MFDNTATEAEIPQKLRKLPKIYNNITLKFWMDGIFI